MENKATSQRSLAKKFFVSLGRVNSVLNEIIDDGFVKKGDAASYEITDKGKEEVSKHKVDAAVILACGMGIRLAPLTFDTPKSFITINGQKMIERQIEQLISAGITDITIMVGFMKEKFDYLIDKYGVKLVYNPEYKYKNTLSTFYHARNIIKNKNVYICVSDVYINENIYHKYETEPYYIGAFYKNCKNEWRYIVDRKNKIKRFELGGANDFCLVGPCFLTKEFLDAFLPLIEKYYNESYTANFYWEDVLSENLDKLPDLYMYKLAEGTIFEFDTLKDLYDYSKETSGFGSEALSFAARALSTTEKDMKNIECMKEGLTNRSYRFTYNGDEYITRVPGENTDEFIDRKSECEILTKLKGKNITEEVIFFDEAKGYKLSKFFHNARPIDINNETELKDAMALYKKFHLLDIKINATSKIIDKNKEYLDIIKEKNVAVLYEDFDIVLSHAKELEKLVEEADKHTVLCHGDANPGNVLVTSDGLRLIDFEYGGMANPLTDIGLFGGYVLFDADKTFELYKMYKAANVGDDSKVIRLNDEKTWVVLTTYLALSGLYNALWAMVRGGVEDADYGTYGMDRYRIFKDCYERLKKAGAV